jgi:hypothetical protein
MKSSTKTIVELIHKNKRYTRLLETFNSAKLYNIPCESLISELKDIHSLREVRRLDTRDAEYVDKLLNANTHDQAQRSRCTEIMMRCVEVTEKLNRALAALKDYLLLEFSDHLRPLRTKEERLLVIKVALRKFSRFLENVAVVKGVADLVIADIDKAAWSMRASTDILKVTRAREVTL